MWTQQRWWATWNRFGQVKLSIPLNFFRTEWGRDFAQITTESGAARQYIRIYNQPEVAARIDSEGNISYD